MIYIIVTDHVKMRVANYFFFFFQWACYNDLHITYNVKMRVPKFFFFFFFFFLRVTK